MEKLIAKKKAIKQGTMQQLLTGQKRLPGFEKKQGYKQTEIGMIPEDWEVKSYGQVFDFLSTASYRNGSCNARAKRIWLNLELAKKPVECIEYIVAHEMVHLLERCHNKKFIVYMDKFLLQWRHYKEKLNRLPLGHVD